ncbi:hypothetical protein PHLCEN_2v4650 [Hermanssonia centrifuga]|uniref:Velvet domain-containing protein n=1 Tax=Hermanssonia centrifuga TaxID=98765 RepID=A0A2R6PMV6_9APHY|nr:hypothetical protein PHLCEN_2v4650 [Hermanssonia centrifuga]
MTPYMQQGAEYQPQAYPFPAQNSLQESNSFQPINPYPPASDAPTWGYPPSTVDRTTQQYGPPTLPSVHAIERSDSSITGAGSSTIDVGYHTAGSSAHAAEGWHSVPRNEVEGLPYRPWPQENPYSTLDGSSDSPLRGTSVQSPAGTNGAWPPNVVDHYAGARYNMLPNPTSIATAPVAQPPSQPVDTSIYASASYAQQQQAQQQQHHHQGASYPQESTPTSTIPPLPRHTYTRTLVGPLSSNACRLLDEHRKPGIFFLFQDLSIRTEGTFRLRLRLMNVGAPPAPEAGSIRIHCECSPVLAQTFTEPFVVFSAKRFPGVPDTTALSIALGNQGQKLPLRNRNNKQGRKRRRNGSDDSGEDSD